MIWNTSLPAVIFTVCFTPNIFTNCLNKIHQFDQVFFTDDCTILENVQHFMAATNIIIIINLL